MLFNALLMEKKTPKIATFPRDFVTLPVPVEDRAMAIHRQHAQKFGKDRACGFGDIFAGRHTDRQTHTQTHTHHNTSKPLPLAK